MLRGEFIRADGLVIPNNITVFGAQTILYAAMRNTVPTFWVGLVDAVPTQDLQIEDCQEPVIGTHGYGRIQILRSTPGWPGSGTVNAEPYVESDWLIWTATGGAFSLAIRRLMLVTSDVAVTGDVFALSAPLPEAILIDAATPEADRKFKYRIYLR